MLDSSKLKAGVVLTPIDPKSKWFRYLLDSCDADGHWTAYSLDLAHGTYSTSPMVVVLDDERLKSLEIHRYCCGDVLEINSSDLNADGKLSLGAWLPDYAGRYGVGFKEKDLITLWQLESLGADCFGRPDGEFPAVNEWCWSVGRSGMGGVYLAEIELDRYFHPKPQV